jgi:hypothetical protein
MSRSAGGSCAGSTEAEAEEEVEGVGEAADLAARRWKETGRERVRRWGLERSGFEREEDERRRRCAVVAAAADAMDGGGGGAVVIGESESGLGFSSGNWGERPALFGFVSRPRSQSTWMTNVHMEMDLFIRSMAHSARPGISIELGSILNCTDCHFGPLAL